MERLTISWGWENDKPSTGVESTYGKSAKQFACFSVVFSMILASRFSLHRPTFFLFLRQHLRQVTHPRRIIQISVCLFVMWCKYMPFIFLCGSPVRTLPSKDKPITYKYREKSAPPRGRRWPMVVAGCFRSVTAPSRLPITVLRGFNYRLMFRASIDTAPRRLFSPGGDVQVTA